MLQHRQQSILIEGVIILVGAFKIRGFSSHLSWGTIVSRSDAHTITASLVRLARPQTSNYPHPRTRLFSVSLSGQQPVVLKSTSVQHPSTRKDRLTYRLARLAVAFDSYTAQPASPRALFIYQHHPLPKSETMSQRVLSRSFTSSSRPRPYSSPTVGTSGMSTW